MFFHLQTPHLNTVHLTGFSLKKSLQISVTKIGTVLVFEKKIKYDFSEFNERICKYVLRLQQIKIARKFNKIQVIFRSEHG